MAEVNVRFEEVLEPLSSAVTLEQNATAISLSWITQLWVRLGQFRVRLSIRSAHAAAESKANVTFMAESRIPSGRSSV